MRALRGQLLAGGLNLADMAERLHASLASVGVTDHHDHAATGIPAHADLSGIVAGDHHQPSKPHLFDLSGVAWSVPGWGIGAKTLSAPGEDLLWYSPIYLERDTAFTRIGTHVRTAGAASNVGRLGIYAATFDADGQLIPDTLTLDAGTVAVDSTGEKAIVIAETLTEGWHFLAFSTNDPSTLRLSGSNTQPSSPVSSFHTTIDATGQFVLNVAVVDGAAALPDPATAPTGSNHFQFTSYAMLRI